MKKSEKKDLFSLEFAAFLQAFGLFLFCALMGLLLTQVGDAFAPLISPVGPVLFLLTFSASALISALITLGYPFLIFWEEKNTWKALKLVILTAAWLAFFVVLFLSLVLFLPALREQVFRLLTL